MNNFCASEPHDLPDSSEGWLLLSHPSAAAQWKTSTGALPAPGWRIEGSCLILSDPAAAESLHTSTQFRDFDLQWEWEIERGGNSGVKYLAQPTSPSVSVPWQIRGSATVILLAAALLFWWGNQRYPRLARAMALILAAVSLFGFGLSVKVSRDLGNSWQNAAVGFEYQMLDDAHNPEGSQPRFRTGELYGILPYSAAPPANQSSNGNSHTSRILVQQQQVQHWLDGQLILAYRLDSPEFQSALAGSKFRGNPQFLSPAPGVIHLQNHQSRVTFRNVRIRPLPPGAPPSP